VTMRLIDGKTITDLLAEGPMAPERAVSITEQIAAALSAAHRAGLVHRDVKPSNILVTDDGFAYLIDFGIARAASGTKLTSTGSTIGTLAYMAPERFTTDVCDARADTYALTCVLYECLTGSQPYPGDSLERQISSHLTQPPPRPSTVRPGLSPQMDQVIATGMAKSPDQRYASTKDLAVAARAALAPAGPQSAPAPAPNWPPPAPGYATPSSYPAAVPYPATAPTTQAASAPTQYGATAGSPPWPPIPVPGATQAQGTSRPWWRGPAILIPVALLAVVTVLIVGIVLIFTWPDKKSNQTTVATQRPSTPIVIPSFPSFPGFTLPTQAPTPAAQNGPSKLQTVDGLNALIASIKSKFGDTMGFQLNVYTEHAVIERVSPENQHVEQDFILYDGGDWQSWGSDTTTSSLDYLADIAAFDVPAVIKTLDGAPQALGAKDNSQSYLIVSGAEGGGIELAIHSMEAGTGFMQVNPDGSVKKVYPP
jgi:hypothetical protein